MDRLKKGDFVKKELTSPPWFKGMTAEEFEARWSEGRLAKEWFDLSREQRFQTHNVKLLLKEIATGKDVDVGLIFALMSLAHDLYLNLIERRAYQKGRYDAWGEVHAEFFGATKTLKENPFAAAFRRQE